MIPVSTPPLTVPAVSLADDLDASVASPVDAFLSDSLERKTYLLIAKPWDEISSSRKTLYFSNDGYASKPGDTLPDGTSLPNQLFRARLAEGGVYNVETRVMSGFELGQGGVPTFGQSQIIIADDDFEICQALGYLWRDAPLQMYFGLPDWDLADFLEGPQGVAAGISHDTMLLSIEWGDLAQRLKRDVQPNVYAGMGACLSGDGVDDRINFGDVWDLTGDFTLRFRIWPNSATNSNSRLWNKDDGATGWLAYVNNLKLGWQVRGASAIETTASPLAEDMWNDCWYSYDATADTLLIAVFQDDEPEPIGAETLAYATSPATNAHALMFGARSDGTSAFSARWDELAIAPGTALDLDTIKTLRSRQLVGTETGFVSGDVYHLNDGTGLTAFATNTANHGTITGATWIGSLTGGPSLAGKKRLRVWGRYLEWEPVNIDEQNGVWQINDGAVQSMDELRHAGLQAYTFVADTADVYSVAPASGEWYSCLAKGIFRLNATVTGRLTMRGKGSNVGSYVEDAAGLVKKIATDEAGLVAADFDLLNFALISSSYPYPVWIGTRLEPVRTWDLMTTLMRENLQGWVTVLEDDRLSVGVLDEPTVAKFSLSEEDVVMDGIRMIAKSIPVKQTVFGYAQYGTTQGPSDISSGVTSQDTRMDLGQEFRSYQTAVNAAVLDGSADAPIHQRNTAIALRADAILEATRTQSFWETQRRAYHVPLVEGFHRYTVGDDIQLSMPLGDLLVPFLGTITAVMQNVPDDIGMEVLGTFPVMALATDTGFIITADDGELIAA